MLIYNKKYVLGGLRLLLSLLLFCSCSAEETPLDAEANQNLSQIAFRMKSPFERENSNATRINHLRLFFFEGQTLLSFETVTYVSSSGSIVSTVTGIPDKYMGKELSVIAVANEKEFPASLNQAELKSVITRIPQDQLKKTGLPMASEEITFIARKGTQEKELRLKRVHSAIYAQISPGYTGSLEDFSVSVSGSQQQGGYLFADAMIEEETGDAFFGDLSGKTSGPDLVGYFYPTQGTITITLTPDPVRYPGIKAKQVSIEASKAVLRNKKYMLNITPPENNIVGFDVQLLAWSESGLVMDFSKYDKNELTDLTVNTGTGKVLMSRHGDSYALALNGKPVSDLKFSLPEGARISPDPNTVFRIPGKYKSEQFTITSASGITGRPFTVQYYPDPVYTLVVLGDTEWNMRGYPMAQAITDANKIARIKREARHAYKEHPKFKYNPELLMVVGDVSPDRDNNPADFFKVFDECYRAGIKCMNIFGNHDWDPEKWSDGPGFSFFAGEEQLNYSRKRIQEAAKKSGIAIEYLIATDKWWYDPMPYAFTYRGVKYYCGNSFWFLPYYRPFGVPNDWLTDPSLWTKPKFKNADPIIESLERMVDRNIDSPVIWMQHYPFVSNDDWWGTFSHNGQYNNGDKRRQKLKELIFKTRNPASFAGHIHYSRVDTYSDGWGKRFTEYVTPYFRSGGGSGYFVLVSEKEGVLSADEFSADSLIR